MTNKTDAFDLEAGVPPIEGEMRTKPKHADRISKRVLMVIFGMVATLVLIFLAALSNVDDKEKPKVVKDPVAEAKNNSEFDEATLVPRDIKEKSKVIPSIADTLSEKKEEIPPELTASKIPKESETSVKAEPAALSPAQQEAELRRQERLARLKAARDTGLAAKLFGAEGGEAAEVVKTNSEASALQQALLAQTTQANQGARLGDVTSPAVLPLGEQEEKLSFLASAKKEENGYHQHVQVPAISANEVKAGDFIPLTLETGINSDLPGYVTARVRENVYDSISGCRLLIPAMTKFMGTYDSKVAVGQGRMLAVWNNAIFKDGSELNLAGMQGYDTSGQAGFASDVDNHYLRTFGLAFGLSMVTAGVQLSIPAPPTSANGSTTQSTSQIVAAALSQQFGQLGGQVLGRYINIQPTLRNFPGERFVVMVPHTIVFSKVWENRCEIK